MPYENRMALAGYFLHSKCSNLDFARLFTLHASTSLSIALRNRLFYQCSCFTQLDSTLYFQPAFINQFLRFFSICTL